jgi:hypothetical protein
MVQHIFYVNSSGENPTKKNRIAKKTKEAMGERCSEYSMLRILNSI